MQVHVYCRVAIWESKKIKVYENPYQVEDRLVDDLLQLIIIQVFSNHHLEHLKKN